jgi:hypothetical protein
MPDEVSAALRLAFDQSPGLWGCKDEDSVFMYANARYGEAVGVKHHMDIVGRTDFDMPCATAACAPLFRAQDKEVMDSGRPLRVLDVHPFAGGEWRAYLFTKTPMMAEHGRIIGTIFHGANITSTSTIELGSLLGGVYSDIAHGDLVDQGSYLIGSDHGAVGLTIREAEVLFFPDTRQDRKGHRPDPGDVTQDRRAPYRGHERQIRRDKQERTDRTGDIAELSE